MKILGLDVSSGAATACLLEFLPEKIKGHRKGIIKLKADKAGIEALLALGAEGAVLEPTGGHYSRLWAHHLSASGVQVRWVDHSALGHYRSANRCTNKSDLLDAVALAAYGVEHWQKLHYFINPTSNALAELAQQLQHQTKPSNVQICMLRQRLEHEWPEVCKKNFQRGWLGPNPAGLLRFIAGEESSAMWARNYETSIGLGLSLYSRQLAAEICLIERHGLELEQAIATEFSSDIYQPYLRALEKCGIREGRLAALLIGHIYPFEQFLDNGKVRRERVLTSGGNKPSRNRSLSAFKLRCGQGLIHYQSGTKEGWRPGGSADLRSAVWIWVFTAVVICVKNKHPAIAQYREIYQRAEGKRNRKISRVGRAVIERVFKEMVAELSQSH